MNKAMADMTDEQLAEAYMDGCAPALDLLLQRVSGELMSHIIYIAHDSDAANDIFQDAILKIIVCLQQRVYTPTGRFASWAQRIAHNKVMDWCRRQRLNPMAGRSEVGDVARTDDLLLVEANIEDRYVAIERVADVERMVAALPQPQREVVHMRYYQQLTFREIAATTNVSINTALGRMHHALKNMRRKLRKAK